MYKNFFKRILDLVLSFLGLIVLAIPFFVIGIVVYVDDPGEVIFKQTRVGKSKRLFTLHKFRSMKKNAPHDVATDKLENAESHITRVGRVLRKTSIDELPQIWDIFVGNMSIIGPRPALPNQTNLLTERDKYGANDVMPGLTGWAQINGRDELADEIKAAYDGEYVRNLSFAFDVKCFFGTIWKVIKREGIVEGTRK